MILSLTLTHELNLAWLGLGLGLSSGANPNHARLSSCVRVRGRVKLRRLGLG